MKGRCGTLAAMSMRSIRCVWLACLTGPLAAQAVLLVGPGGFAQIDPAIAAAAPHDVIQVAAGTYLPFTLYKPLTITALPGGPGQIVQIRGVTYPPTVTVLRPPAGTRSFVTGLHFRNDWFLWPLETRVESGTICFEECTFEGNRSSHEAGLHVQNAEVVLRHCLVLGGDGNWGGPGMTCNHSSVFASDSFIRGGATSIDAFFSGGDGITVDDSELHLVRVDVVGGDCNFAACHNGWVAGPGVRVRGTSHVWIADCTLRGGDGLCAAGGDGLRNQTTTPVQLARTPSNGGPGVPPGQSIFGPTQQQTLLGLAGTTVGLFRGQPWLADYRTGPGWPVAVVLAPDVLVSADARVAEWLLLPPANLTTFALLVADSAGDAVLQTTVPPLAILQHQHAYLQAFSGLALPLRTQPPLGGVIR
jgi:hypothetical protein